MRDLLDRLRTAKLIITSLTLTTSGTVLIALEQQIPTWNVWRWIQLVPYGEVGGIFIGAGLISVWIDRFFRREQDETDELRLRRVLEDEAPAIRDAVLHAFAANKPDLQRVATPQLLDQLIRNSLALRLGDEQFATEVYDDIKTQAIEAQERWHDASLDITLTPLPATKAGPAMFEVTVHWEYTTIPKHAQRRFVALSDRAEYAELAQSGGNVSPWYVKPRPGYTAADRATFELLQFSVDGEERRISRSVRKGGQTYTVNVGSEAVAAGAETAISYTYRTITPQAGHLLFFDIEQPTRDIRVTFDYTAAQLAAVSAIDLVPSANRTRIEHSPAEVTPRTIRVDIDGWTFPRSGLAFVWANRAEAAAQGHSQAGIF